MFFDRWAKAKSSFCFTQKDEFLRMITGTSELHEAGEVSCTHQMCFHVKCWSKRPNYNNIWFLCSFFRRRASSEKAHRRIRRGGFPLNWRIVRAFFSSCTKSYLDWSAMWFLFIFFFGRMWTWAIVLDRYRCTKLHRTVGLNACNCCSTMEPTFTQQTSQVCKWHVLLLRLPCLDPTQRANEHRQQVRVHHRSFQMEVNKVV